MHRRDKKYKCLIFDFDGTLIDSAAAITQSVIASAKLNSLPVPDIMQVKAGIGKSFDSQYINLFINNFSAEQAHYSYKIKSKFAVDFRKFYVEQNLLLFAGAKQLLELLRVHNYELAISTNGPRSMLNRMLQHFGIAKYFAVTCCGDEFMAKPDSEMLMHILLELGHDCSDAIMIGDSLADIEAATNVDIDTVLIENHNLEDIKKSCSPSFIVQNLQDILNII
jgi:phosphoglycolate phosphatase